MITVENMKISEIIQYENNPSNNDAAVDKVAESIKEFGFKVPIIVDKDNVIIAGHTRYKAAVKLGLEIAPVIKADDLTEQQVKAFRIMDNKSSEFATWNYEVLLQELEELRLDDYDLDLIGFNLNEFEQLEDKYNSKEIQE
jgi:ParB-like chromosome segregation protein Spo0J